MTDARRQAMIVEAASKKFRCFGGGRTSDFNLLADYLKDEPPMFAAGVNVEDVVSFVISYDSRLSSGNP